MKVRDDRNTYWNDADIAIVVNFDFIFLLAYNGRRVPELFFVRLVFKSC